jgi:[acyl-carrier-protein] S-malonyltransferase
MALAYLFPGQGAQEVGMGKALARSSAAARAVYEQADAALGEPLSALCFEGPLDQLTLTRNTQPAIVATSVAVVAALRERYPNALPPALAAGHSLGEYSALVIAGALSLEDAVRLCRVRGAAMQDAVAPGAGAMAAILGLDQSAVVELCAEAAQGEVVAPANFNAPGQIVIAGAAAAVLRASQLAAQRRGKAIALNVSAPFHCALMRPAAERLADELARTNVQPLAIPVLANVDAEPNLDPSRVADLLVRQVDAPVQWVRTIERMAELGVTHALELGPGKVLAGLVKRITKRIRVLSVSDAESLEQVGPFLAASE